MILSSRLDCPMSLKTPNMGNTGSVASGIEIPIPCYFMVADILGFSKMMKNLDGHRQAQRITEWKDLVQHTGLAAGVTESQLISDTLFVREEDSIDGLARLLKFGQLLLERGIDKSIPLRGAIVHGNAAWGELPYGDAVIQAHQIEQSLDWIGIACAPNLPRIGLMWDWDLVIVYPVPRKAGLTRLVPAVSWNVPRTNSLIVKVSANGLMAEVDHYRWEEIAKVERTIQFGIYRRICKSNGSDPQHYSSWFPMHFIEDLLG